ncbi:sugar ABC transporter permease [Clostridium chromiireducens]|uniref:ABC transporter permease subunit n=1 Tax=Clostridium chromiireducens TaxID=225345 RepID=A0A1V4J120_9CLOT|nr:ABC transporter permease subunit [Clostridium chromiireducens]MVX64369.1 ABC transporter permease subunit [Clostridium chromiireducens]OPJ65715.1 maltose transport system permease protein MalG [Clostridium chromiireducens]
MSEVNVSINKQLSISEERLTYRKRMTKREWIELWGKRLFLIVSILIIIFPIFAIIAASLSTGTSFMQKNLIPTAITFENYQKALSDNIGFVKWMVNTTFVAVLVSIIQLAMTLPAAFAFSRLKFIGRKKGLMLLLILQMFPTIMSVPAILAVAYRLSFGMDNLIFLSLILCAGSAYNIWLMKGYMDGLPKELDEAAKVDGATVWQIFTKIILPLTKSMSVVIFFFSFIAVYGEFVFSASLLKDKDLKTLVIGLKSFTAGKLTDWPMYSACSIMISVPLAILFVAIQKFISKGLVSGAVKE